MNMIEKMARAMEREHTMRDMLHTGPDFPAIARAALMALREPDEAMVEAGGDKIRYDVEFDPDLAAKDIWTAMLDQILNEKG